MKTADLRIHDAFSAWCIAIRDLLLPRGCAGCDAPDEVLCPSCAALFRHAYSRQLPGKVGYCYGCSWYQGAVRHAILNWKDHGDEECDRIFAVLMADLTAKVLRRQGACAHGCALALVPAPSSPSSMHRRGRWQTLPLTRLMSRSLNVDGLCAVTKPVLKLEGVHGKSVQAAGAASRSRRIDGHVHVAQDLSGDDSLFVVVDDIVTTGATMGQCMSALTAAGARRVIGLALACTPNRSQ
ncbi:MULTISPECIES: phosphoribosyltransferase family protein [unclassified Bifidobacterium]|uniref:ComF family protein n=1 Tax=unclassified Bifidobacterium TaxID=2608897 RepID=UPI0023F6620E|nr:MULTISPECIES: phosphoribosyltransferase family protein [unclassified Bifidobacterium]WEV65199.1 phosphoribosyltransferase family protein [Bifidobacterium sp. ESL0764]WEV75988.1 phosphoribosyltransferase family protein [Bifidobacterium sp. ESL0800]